MGDDRVSGVIDARSTTEDVADETRAATDLASVAVGIVRRHAMDRRHDGELEPVEVDRIVRLHRQQSRRGYDVRDEFDERRREDDTRPGGPIEENGQEREIEVIEVLVRDEEPVDIVGGELERGRRHEPVDVRADPRIDDHAYPLHLEAKAGLAQPR